MIDPEDEKEILHLINSKIGEFKRKYPLYANLLLSQVPNLSSIASEIPQCTMDYTLKEILEFLIKAQQDGRIRI